MSEEESTAEDFLARAPLFARLGRRSLRKLAGLCVPRDFDTGAVLISEGDTGLGLFVVVSGRVEVTKGEGPAKVRFAVMERGDLLGEMALIDDQPRSASAVALEPSRCLLITRNSFLNLAEKDPEIAWCLLPTLADRIRDLQQKLLDSGAVAPRLDDGVPGDGPPPDMRTTEPEERSRDPLLSLVRGQVALAIAAAAGLRGAAAALERFLRELVDDSGLDDADHLDQLTDRVPESLRSATAAGLEGAERVPEQLLERYLRYRNGRETR
jgi:CRP/FNR family transcriptional regulator